MGLVEQRWGWVPRGRRKHRLFEVDGIWRMVCTWKVPASVTGTSDSLTELGRCRNCVNRPHKEALKWIV